MQIQMQLEDLLKQEILKYEKNKKQQARRTFFFVFVFFFFGMRIRKKFAGKNLLNSDQKTFSEFQKFFFFFEFLAMIGFTS